MIMLALLAFACGGEAPHQEEEVVVRVGEAVLTLDDLADDIPAAIRSRISKQEIQNHVVRWINSEVLYQEARRRGLDQQIDLQRELKRVERELMGDALVQKEIYETPVAVTDDEARSFYEANKESFRRNEIEARVYHLGVPAKRTADSLYRELRNSGDGFATMARILAIASGDTSTWNMTIVASEQPEALRPIFKLRPGAVGAPIELDDGFHIFQLIEIFQAGTYRDLSLVKDEIVSRIQTRKRDERYRALLAELSANSKVETNFQMLESMPLDSLFARAGR